MDAWESGLDVWLVVSRAAPRDARALQRGLTRLRPRQLQPQAVLSHLVRAESAEFEAFHGLADGAGVLEIDEVGQGLALRGSPHA